MAHQPAIQDTNQQYAITAHSGTAGTADVIRLVATADGALTVSGTVVSSLAVNSGTLSTLGTVGSVTNVGTIKEITNIAGGTITTTLALNSGTITTVAAGTQNTLGTVGTVIGIGTVTGIGALPAHAISLGTVLGPNASAGTSTTAPVQIGGTTATGTVYAFKTDTSGNQFANIVTGTLQSAGTTTGVGVVSNLTNGTVRISVGTITTGSLTNIANIVTQTAGTLNTLGTVGVVNNIVTGTLASVKLNAIPAGSIVLSNHVLGTSGAALFGTLLATAGAGTNVYLSGLQIVVHSGTPDCAVTNNVAGSTGAGVYARGVFPPGGGIARSFFPPINCGAAGTLCYYINTGTASFIVNYWVAP